MYHVESIEVNRGMFKDAYARIPEKLEAALNEGCRKGWRLQDWKFAGSPSDPDLNIVIVWEV